MSNGLLEVRGLTVRVEDKEILHGIDLEIQKGETHVPVSYTHLDVYKRQGQGRGRQGFGGA